MSIKREKVKVYDMTCTTCEVRIEKSLQKLKGVVQSRANYSGQYVEVEYDTQICNISKIKNLIKASGYSTEKSKDYTIVGLLIIVIAIIFLGNSSKGFNMNEKLNNATYFILFIVGLFSSIHCVGMCGGIMLTQSLSNNCTNKFEAIKPALLYNVGRVVSYSILGGIIGALGSVFSLSIQTKAALELFAGAFMIIMGLNMSGFGLFRKIHIKLPISICSVKNRPNTPFIVGLLNGFMPCGPLQTMQLYALGTGSALKGFLSMLVFGIGTVPLMLIFGAISGALSKSYTKKILKFSGILIIILGLIMSNRGLALTGINTNPLRIFENIFSGQPSKGSIKNSSNSIKPIIKDGVQIINMDVTSNGYIPNLLYIQKNLPVRWIITGKQITSCNGQIEIPALNIEKKLSTGENIIEFDAQNKDINFSCSMGMLKGVIKVVDDASSIDTSKDNTSVPTSSNPENCHGESPSATEEKSTLYGDDLSKVPAEKLVNKAVLLGNYQSWTIKGVGKEFDPLIVIVNKGTKTKLFFDLTKFNNSEGTFTIVDPSSSNILASFEGKQGLNDITLTFETEGGYGIIKDNTLLGIIEVVDDMKNTNFEEVKTKYIK